MKLIHELKKKFSFSPDLIKAIALHVALVLLLAFSFPNTPTPKIVASNKSQPNLDSFKDKKIPDPKKIISAGLVDRKLIESATQRQKNADIRRKRQLQAESRKLARTKRSLKDLKTQEVKTKRRVLKAKTEVEKAKELAKAEIQRALKNKKLAEEAKKKELLAKQKAEQESMRAKKEAERAKALADKIEKEKLLARRNWLDSEFSRFVGQVKYNVLSNRSLTFAFDKDLVCEIEIKLTSNGDLISAQVVKSSGNPAYDNNSKTAVLKSAPFDMPSDPELNQRVRSIKLKFKQEEA